MGTQATPEQEQEQIAEEQNQESDTTQPTSETPAPAPQVNPEILQTYQQELLNQTRRNADLERRLNEMQTQRPVVDEEVEKQQYFENPLAMIRKEISGQLQPLNQFQQQLVRQQNIEAAKAQMRQASQQFPYLSKVEGIFDNYMSGVSNIDINTVVAAYNAAVGAFVSQNGWQSLTDTQTTTNAAPTTTNQMSAPPHVRPSAPPAQTKADKKPKLRELTEDERKIARFNRMSDEQYVKWTDEIPVNEVASYKEPEPKKEK